MITPSDLGYEREPPNCAGIGLAPIKTKAVQISESCAHEVHAGSEPQWA